MIDPDDLEIAARAMQESNAWPAVFRAGSARVLAAAAIEALARRGRYVNPDGIPQRRRPGDREYAAKLSAIKADAELSRARVEKHRPRLGK